MMMVKNKNKKKKRIICFSPIGSSSRLLICWNIICEYRQSLTHMSNALSKHERKGRKETIYIHFYYDENWFRIDIATYDVAVTDASVVTVAVAAAAQKQRVKNDKPINQSASQATGNKTHIHREKNSKIERDEHVSCSQSMCMHIRNFGRRKRGETDEEPRKKTTTDNQPNLCKNSLRS